MKITVWLATRERFTWITAMELLGLTAVLLTAPATWLRVLLGLPLLAHVGYRALTSLPMGAVPRRPERGQPRERYDLRATVVRFLDEVRRLDEFASRAEMAARPEMEREEMMRTAKARLMLAATQVAQATGHPVAKA